MKSRALNETPSRSYGMSLAMWDHTVFPATRQTLVRTRRLKPQPLDLPTPEGWKAELTLVTGYRMR